MHRLVPVLSSSPRLFSTYSHSRPINTTRFVQLLSRESRDPIWRLLDALRSQSHRNALSEALHAHNVSVDLFSDWNPILHEADIHSAVTTAKSHPPSWVVLYLVGYKVRTPDHAAGPMMHLVHAHLDVAPKDILGPLLVLAMVNLARFNLLVPMRGLLDTFLTLPLTKPALYFNLLLQAMACNPTRSIASANAAVTVLRTMESRQLKLRPDTYESILKDRFVTLQLTKYLRERMVREGLVPNAQHLEAYLRIFAKNGAIHDAQGYFDAIHARAESSLDDPESDASMAAHRANTLFLGAQEDRASAFTFLGKLASSSEPTEKGVAVRAKPRLSHKRVFDTFDWTAALSVAARDFSISDRGLIDVFERSQTKPPFIRPTVASYTVLIQGLLARHSFTHAEQYWHKLHKTGLPLDRESLTAGLLALTRVGKPHEAFAVLEKYAGRGKAPKRYRFLPPIALTSVSLNEFLVALLRISRPDIVMRLWDHMYALYGVHPDADTLSILLQSARLAMKLDDSFTFSGAVAQLALHNPFRTRTRTTNADNDHDGDSTYHARRIAFSDITATLGNTTTGLKPYASGVWHDQLPLAAARTVFLQAIFGTHGAALRDVRAPARAVRASPYEDPMTPLGIRNPLLAPVEYRLVQPPGENPPPLPSVVPTHRNFFHYITLLGVGGRAVEIPLALAWMRAMRITPSPATLAVALVFWAEVSVNAPLIEAWAGGAGRGEYVRLVEWIRGWVGERRVPGEEELGKWGRIVREMRERER